MTLQELRQRWQEIKDRPISDRERRDIEAELFWHWNESCKNFFATQSNKSSDIINGKYASSYKSRYASRKAKSK